MTTANAGRPRRRNAKLYVILWERDMRPLTGAAAQTDRRFLGGMVRLCWEHLDELAILIAEVL
jgi:hypothetical protein